MQHVLRAFSVFYIPYTHSDLQHSSGRWCSTLPIDEAYIKRGQQRLKIVCRSGNCPLYTKPSLSIQSDLQISVQHLQAANLHTLCLSSGFCLLISCTVPLHSDVLIYGNHAEVFL